MGYDQFQWGMTFVANGSGIQGADPVEQAKFTPGNPDALEMQLYDQTNNKFLRVQAADFSNDNSWHIFNTGSYWTNITFVYDGATDHSGSKIYINGFDATVVASGSTDAGFTSFIESTGPLGIGNYLDSRAIHVKSNGQIAEFAAWNTQLTQYDVDTIVDAYRYGIIDFTARSGIISTNNISSILRSRDSEI